MNSVRSVPVTKSIRLYYRALIESAVQLGWSMHCNLHSHKTLRLAEAFLCPRTTEAFEGIKVHVGTVMSDG